MNTSYCLLLCTIACFISAGIAIYVEELPDAVAKARMIRQVNPSLTQRSFDFQSICPPGVSLVLGSRRLNVPNLRLSSAEALQIVPVLYDQPLEERVDIICKKAFATQQAALSVGRSAPQVIDITQDPLFEGDILLDSNTADLLLQGPFSLRPSPREDLGIVPNTEPTLLQRGPILVENPPPGFVARPPPNFIQSNVGNLAQPNSVVLPFSSRTRRRKRKIVALQQNQWPNAVMPWFFRPGQFSSSEQQAILRGIASWEQKTCLRMPQSGGGGTSSVEFIKANGCYSNIGRVGGNQPISIGQGCDSLGIVTHEIGHAIGMLHEQSRPDRDDYLSINTNNIASFALGNFNKQSWRSFYSRKVPYDPSSVMHYAQFDFGITASQPVLVYRDPNWQTGMGQRNDISFMDAKLANLVYCNTRCGSNGLESSQCQNEGYLNPNQCNQCICPPGFAPPTCSNPVQSPSICGTTSLSADGNIRTLLSPNYNSGNGPTNTDCYYLIQAPQGQRVRVTFTGTFIIQAPARACRAFVEIRHQTMTLAGPRFCGTNRPTGTFISHGRSMLIRLFTLTQSTRGFQLRYQAEGCGGCGASPAASEPVCLQTEITRCDDQNSGRENRCFDPRPNSAGKQFCCSGYQQQGSSCIATATPPTTQPTTPTTQPTTPTTTTTPPPTTETTTPPTTQPTTPPTTEATTLPTTQPTTPPTISPSGWSEWGEWSTCSRTCGNCGTRYRIRSCLRGSCSGRSFEFERCASTACTGFRIRRRCRFTPFRICYSITNSKFCCSGRVEGDQCV